MFSCQVILYGVESEERSVEIRDAVQTYVVTTRS